MKNDEKRGVDKHFEAILRRFEAFFLEIEAFSGLSSVDPRVFSMSLSSTQATSQASAPERTAVVARRLIFTHLGLKLSALAPFKTSVFKRLKLFYGDF